jgi:hypothetical protein
MKIDSTSYFEGKEGIAGFYGELRGGYTFVVLLHTTATSRLHPTLESY